MGHSQVYIRHGTLARICKHGAWQRIVLKEGFVTFSLLLLSGAAAMREHFNTDCNLGVDKLRG
jgi:hypothetical protein